MANSHSLELIKIAPGSFVCNLDILLLKWIDGLARNRPTHRSSEFRCSMAADCLEISAVYLSWEVSLGRGL